MKQSIIMMDYDEDQAFSRKYLGRELAKRGVDMDYASSVTDTSEMFDKENHVCAVVESEILMNTTGLGMKLINAEMLRQFYQIVRNNNVWLVHATVLDKSELMDFGLYSESDGYFQKPYDYFQLVMSILACKK